MSILQNILDKVGGQVNEEFFRQQLIQELGSTNFDDDAADLGCNLHYLRLTQREELAMSLLNNSAQGAVAVPRRTLHKYVYGGVRGQPYRIPESEWTDVAQLPTERFVDMRGISVPRSRIYNTN